MPKQTQPLINTVRLEQSGYIWLRGFYSLDDLQRFRKENLDGIGIGKRFSTLSHDPLIEKLTIALQSGLPKVRARQFTAFDKSSDKNWGTAWHQDRVIAVRRRHAISGYINWTQKSGHWFCEPPVHILNAQCFARIHFDDCDSLNGCLRVAEASHLFGKIKAQDIDRVIEQSRTGICEAKAGDVLIAKALILHCSKASQSGSSRLALKIDYSATTLPEPLDWAFGN